LFDAAPVILRLVVQSGRVSGRTQKWLAGTAGVPLANEREARKWIGVFFWKTARPWRVCVRVVRCPSNP